MALSGNVWLWVHWVSRYTWPTSVGWRAVNGAQVCPPAPPYSMIVWKITKSMGLLIKLWTTPRFNYLTHLTTSPDPLISFYILPNKFPFSDKLPTLVDSVQGAIQGLCRHKGTAPAAWSCGQFRGRENNDYPRNPSPQAFVDIYSFSSIWGPQNSPQVFGLLVWETHGSCWGSWGQLLFQSWCVASFNISRFHPTEAEANPSFCTKPTGVQPMHCGTPKSHLGRWGQDGEQLLRQFKRFCSNWLHVFQARGWRWNSPHNFQLICWGIVPSPSVLHSFAIPRYLAKKGPQDTLFSAGVLHRSNQLPQEGHCAEGLVPWWWGGLKSVKKRQWEAMRGYPKFYQMPSLYPIA